MLGNMFNNATCFYPFLNPMIYDEISRMGNYNRLNLSSNREKSIIVSLTSKRESFSGLNTTIYSLFNQSLKPDKIVLWLDEETEDLTTLPYQITRFIKNGLEIRFVKYINVYTKSIYAFKEFNDSIIVTAENGIYYRYDWLRRLYLSYIANPEDIHVHLAHRVLLNNNGGLLPFKMWRKNINDETASYGNFIAGEGGVLYPPNCFTKEIFRADIFKSVQNNDNVWFWVMALLHNKKIRVVKNHYKQILCVKYFEYLFTNALDKIYSQVDCDSYIQLLLKYYGRNVFANLNSIDR